MLWNGTGSWFIYFNFLSSRSGDFDSKKKSRRLRGRDQELWDKAVLEAGLEIQTLNSLGFFYLCVFVLGFTFSYGQDLLPLCALEFHLALRGPYVVQGLKPSSPHARQALILLYYCSNTKLRYFCSGMRQARTEGTVGLLSSCTNLQQTPQILLKTIAF